MLQTIESINNVVNNFIWGVPAMICIIGVGLYLSLRTGFVQIRKFPYALKTTLGRIFKKKEASDGSMTPFQAVCTALAGTVGTGKYRRCCRSYRHRRTGSCILDVGFRAPWNVHEIYRGYPGSTFP